MIEDFIESLNMFRKHGFTNINVDLMFSSKSNPGDVEET